MNQITCQSILCGDTEKAINYLLETPPSSDNYIVDALKACILASSISPNFLAETVKCVATYFVANGDITEGIQLLIASGKQLEACKYLQANDRYLESILLAKSSLKEEDCFVVMMSWCDHCKRSGNLKLAGNIALATADLESTIALLDETGVVIKFY